MQSTRTTTKRYNLTPADSTVSYMFLIAWTDAPVVKVQITRDFKLTSYKVSNIRGQYTVLEVRQITVKAGQVLHFTRSGMDKMYYLTSTEGCTCKAGRFKQPCHHVDDVTAFVAKREQKAVVTSEVTTEVIETKTARIPAGTTIYRTDGQILFYEDLWSAWFCTCQEASDGSGCSYNGCEHSAHIQELTAFIAAEQAA